MTIFDLVTSQGLASYWTELSQDRDPYPCEELFPNDKKRGLNLKWLKGSKGLPVVLKTSAFDVAAVPRPRIGFEKLSADMPYFKESKYIDEEMRQELNMVMESGIQGYIDAVMDKIFDDQTELLEAAVATRERMRMMALTTGVVSMTSNGQAFTFDYGVEHKGDAATAWSNLSAADPLEDIRVAKEKIQDETGTVVTRGMCDQKVWRNLRNNEKIKKDIFVLTQGVGAITDKQLHQYIVDQLEIDIRVNSKRYKDEKGAVTPYMPADTLVLFPDGALGKTWFGTTPAESDLMSASAANVSIVDTGVSITSVKKEDPVQVETIVAMICLPDFPMADQVYIMDTEPAGSAEGSKQNGNH